MDYNQPYGKPPEVVWGDTPYVNGNPSTGIQGSIPPAASIEYPQRELVNLFRNTGLITPSNTDLNQLSKAIQTGMMHYGVDTGTKNNLQVNLQPAPDEYYDGMFIFVVPAIANDSAATINVNALGARNIVRRGGGPVVAGDLPLGYKSLLCYSKLHNNFELYGINFGATGGFIPVLESVRRLQAGLQSFLSMRRIEARRKNASAFWLRHSQSLAKRRQRLSHAMVRSTIQRLGKTANPLI